MKLRSLLLSSTLLALAIALCATIAPAADAPGPVKTQINKTADGKWQLIRDGKLYFIKGAGGGYDKSILAQLGGNSFRTWGVGDETQAELDEAQKLGLTVTVGVWLGHKGDAFSYKDPATLKRQFDSVKKSVERFKNHPAVLCWAMGNEMENGNDVPELWNHIEDLAKMVHEVDPNHPVMTVVAEIGGDKVTNIHKFCPDLDLIGINTYAGGSSITQRYVKAGGTKPIVITEFGPGGTWETPMNAFGAPNELTSTAKAEAYKNCYVKSVLGAPDLCLGSYAFTWGYKIEATSTWYGMFLPDKSKLAAVDTMHELWTGKAPEKPCPVMSKLSMITPDQIKAGDTMKAIVEATDPKGDTIKIDWQLFREQSSYGVEGTGAAATAAYPEAIVKNGEKEVTIKAPEVGGIYRIYCYVHNTTGGAAVGSLPVKVKGSKAAFKAPPAALPFVVYSSQQKGEPPYAPSGIMGSNMPAIAVDLASTDNPRVGKTCLKVEYKEGKGWAGCVWQSPPNDWGNKPGGYDLTQAEKLTFWARGAVGGEKVTFGLGTIGIEKRFHDSGKAELKDVALTKEWKQYSIDLSEVDLSCIKSGFRWNLAAQGDPVTFYLDDIKYEGEAP